MDFPKKNIVIFHSYVSLPEANQWLFFQGRQGTMAAQCHGSKAWSKCSARSSRTWSVALEGPREAADSLRLTFPDPPMNSQ